MKAVAISNSESVTSERVATVGHGGELTLPDSVMHELRLLRPEPFLVFSEGRQFVHMIRAEATELVSYVEAIVRSGG